MKIIFLLWIIKTVRFIIFILKMKIDDFVIKSKEKNIQGKKYFHK